MTTWSTLEATGALGLIVRLAEKLLRRHPQFVVYLAPLCTFCLTMLVATGHAVYPLLPVIYDVAYRKGIRPERAMGIASVASQMGITASPISAATAATIGIAARAGVHLNLIDIVRVTLPSLFIGMLIAATWSLKRGKDLNDDIEFQTKMKDPKMREYIEGETATTPDQPVTRDAKVALGLFIASIIAIVLIAIFPDKVLPVDSYAYFFFCFYPSDLAAINFDRSGTTHIGKWILNHSFMIPGLIGVWSSVAIAYLLSNFVFSIR